MHELRQIYRSPMAAIARASYRTGSVLSEESWHRARHLDLGGMDTAELRRELWRCRQRLAWADRREWDYPWLVERERRILDELRRRRQAGEREPQRSPSPPPPAARQQPSPRVRLRGGGA